MCGAYRYLHARPFGLRWFVDSEFDATLHCSMSGLANDGRRNGRLLPKEHVQTMEAIEATIALQMVRPAGELPS